MIFISLVKVIMFAGAGSIPSIPNGLDLRESKRNPDEICLKAPYVPLISHKGYHIQRSAKKYANLATQDPGRARQNS